MSEWISVEEDSPRPMHFVDVYLKSTKNSTYGVRMTDVLYTGEKFNHRDAFDLFLWHTGCPYPHHQRSDYVSQGDD